MTLDLDGVELPSRPPERRRPLLGRARRLLERLASRVPLRPLGPCTSALLRRSPKLASIATRLANLLNRPDVGIVLLESAAARGGLRPTRDLATAYLSAGDFGPRNVQHIGLVTGTIGRHSQAYRLGGILVARGDPLGPEVMARARLSLDGPEAAQRVISRYSVDKPSLDREVLLTSWRDASNDRSLTEELLRQLIDELSAGETANRTWLLAVDLLLRLRRFDDACEIARASNVPEAVHTAEWGMAVAQHRFHNAAALRDSFAQMIVVRPPSRFAHIDDVLLRARAAMHLGDIDGALRSVEQRKLCFESDKETLACDRLSADLALLRGEREPLHAMAERLPSPTPIEDLRFRRSVEGRRVLVVGPSPSFRPTAAQLASADTIVTTRHAFADASIASQVVYAANDSLLADDQDYRNLQRLGAQIVARPTSFEPLRSRGWLNRGFRVQAFEDSTPLLGTAFALPRLLHDLLAHGAAAITLTCVDFFVGSNSYRDGYRSGDEYALFNPAHDPVHAHQYVARLSRHGLLTGSDGVGRILELTREEYLDELEESASWP